LDEEEEVVEEKMTEGEEYQRERARQTKRSQSPQEYHPTAPET